MPLVLGWDVSGMLPYPNGVGAYAEYVTGPTRAFTHKPAGIDHIQVGALPLTAYQALVETAEVRARQRVVDTTPTQAEPAAA